MYHDGFGKKRRRKNELEPVSGENGEGSNAADTAASVIDLMTTLESGPISIAGQWQQINSTPTSPVFNPSTGEVIAETPMCGPKEVDAAVQAAATAFPAWMETPPVERARIFFKFKM